MAVGMIGSMLSHEILHRQDYLKTFKFFKPSQGPIIICEGPGESPEILIRRKPETRVDNFSTDNGSGSESDFMDLVGSATSILLLIQKVPSSNPNKCKYIAVFSKLFF